jgi:hypothetical protein
VFMKLDYSLKLKSKWKFKGKIRKYLSTRTFNNCGDI